MSEQNEAQVWRDRKFRLELYPEDESHVKCMELLEKGGYTYAAILHDKDTWREDDPKLGDHEIGSPKKPHWHVVVKFPNPRYSSAIVKALGIAPNYMRACDDLDGALLYLVHYGKDEKYQYDITEVQGTLAARLSGLLAEQGDEGARVLQIVEMVDQSPGRASYREILVKCCKAGLYGEFRRLGSGVKYLIDEHNAEYYDSEGMQLTRQRLEVVYDKAKKMSWQEKAERYGRMKGEEAL